MIAIVMAAGRKDKTWERGVETAMMAWWERPSGKCGAFKKERLLDSYGSMCQLIAHITHSRRAPVCGCQDILRHQEHIGVP